MTLIIHKRGSEADEGYKQLYQAILQGEFQPNEHMIQMDLIQRYNDNETAA